MGSMKIWTGSAWETASAQGPAGTPGAPGASVRELAYAEITTSKTIASSSSTTPDLIVATPAVTFDGVTPVLVEMFSPAAAPASPAASALLFYLWLDGVSIGKIGQMTTPAAGAGFLQAPVFLVRRLTPTAGSHTFGWYGMQTGGNGIVTAGNGAAGAAALPAYIRISVAS